MRKIITKQGIDVYRVNNDVNGNPRYVVHFLSLNLDSAKPTDKTRSVGLSKYRGKDFNGGFVFTSYNVDQDLERILKELR